MSYRTDHIHRSFSLYEIIANSATHALGVGLSIAALVVLIIQAVESGDPWYLGGVIAYGISLILLYLASTVYHSTPQSSGNALLQRLDHAAIFVLIAGTYTLSCSPSCAASMAGSPLAWSGAWLWQL
jgi:hemolysin III